MRHAGAYLGADARAPGDSAVVLVAGDIARCDSPGDERTAELLDRLPGTILAAGDLAYMDGTAEEFRRCYGPTWGRHRQRTRPAPGNHEYNTPGATPYYAYFGEIAGPDRRGYYSFDLNGWHVVSLNSNVAMHRGSPQERWLRADLAAHPSRCTLAMWHHPRFSSGGHGDTREVEPLWRALHDAGADVVVQAHDHLYERFARMDATGRVDDDRGIRSFVSGGGGAPLRRVARRHAGSVWRIDDQWGVLRLTLRPESYRWEFVTVDGRSLDQGGEACR